MVVNSPYTVKFTFTLPDTLSQSDTLTIKFPTGTSMTFSTGTVASNFGLTSSATTYDSATQTVSLGQSSRTINRLTSMFFQFGSYTAPTSILPTTDFTLTVWNSGYMKMQGTVTLTATTSTVSGTVTPISSVVNAQTSYTFSIALIDAITSSGMIKITMPATVTIVGSSSNCASATGTNVNSAPVCAFNTLENSITLSSLNSSTANISPQTISISISGLQNPPSSEPTGTFSVRTYYQSTTASLVAIGTLPAISATTATIPSSAILVTPSSTVVNAQSVGYKLQATINNKIPVGGYFTINIPPSITVNTASVSNQCSVNINFTSFVSTACSAGVASASGTLITFSNPFASDATVGTVVIAQITLVFTNPPSTKPTLSFSFSTFSNTGYSIASISSAIFIAMDTADSFIDSTITRTSAVNYALTSYKFSFTQLSPLEASSIVMVTFPSDVVPSSTPTCTLTLPAALAGTLGCSQSGMTLTVTLPSTAIAASTLVTLSVSNVRNPPSFKPSGSYTLQTKTANNLYRYSHGISSPALTNTVATSFQSITFLFTPTVLGEPTVLKVNFDPSVSTLVPSVLWLTFADSFTINTLACNSFVDFSGTCSVVVGVPNTLQVSGTFVDSSMSFSVSGITAPSTVPTDFSSVITFDSSLYKIDESTNKILFNPGCTLPCRTCSATLTACLSCYASPISTFVYRDTTLLTCN